MRFKLFLDYKFIKEKNNRKTLLEKRLFNLKITYHKKKYEINLHRNTI